MTQKELDIILDKHKKWLSHEEGSERADLRCTDLCHANLAYKSLNRARKLPASYQQVRMSKT